MGLPGRFTGHIPRKQGSRQHCWHLSTTLYRQSHSSTFCIWERWLAYKRTQTQIFRRLFPPNERNDPITRREIMTVFSCQWQILTFQSKKLEFQKTSIQLHELHSFLYLKILLRTSAAMKISVILWQNLEDVSTFVGSAYLSKHHFPNGAHC